KDTLKALERGDREMSEQKAVLFSNLFSTLFAMELGEDAHKASFEYIYNGKITKTKEMGSIVARNPDDGRIRNELDFYEKSPFHILLKIPDKTMSPLYEVNDFVVGRKVINSKQFSRYEGCVCLIEDSKGKMHLRKIERVDKRTITPYAYNVDDS